MPRLVNHEEATTCVAPTPVFTVVLRAVIGLGHPVDEVPDLQRTARTWLDDARGDNRLPSERIRAVTDGKPRVRMTTKTLVERRKKVFTMLAMRTNYPPGSIRIGVKRVNGGTRWAFVIGGHESSMGRLVDPRIVGVHQRGYWAMLWSSL